MTESKSPISPRRVIAIIALCGVGIYMIKRLPEICNAVPVVVAVACLAIASYRVRLAQSRKCSLAFLVSMSVQFLGWFFFVVFLRNDWYGVLYYPVAIIYDCLGLIPHAEFAGIAVVVIEVPIVGATVYSLIAAAIVGRYVKRQT